MQWQTLLNAKRLGGRAAKVEAGRSAFLSDHDKIIFSGAFRRLARKTQVHPLANHDMVHNRMTHSLEVACVGRTLAIRVGERLQAQGKLPEKILPTDLGDIVQTTCLAHDIGNPPFGHTGEKAIQQWFKHEGAVFLQHLSLAQRCDFIFFDGNAQGLRILSSSESLQCNTGMHLTYASFAAFMKYPWSSKFISEKQGQKFGFFVSEMPMVEQAAEAVGLRLKSTLQGLAYARHPLSFLMEAADDFCYGLIDLEDGLYMNILQWQELFQVIKPLFDDVELGEIENQLVHVSENQRPHLVRGRVMDAYIGAAVDAFMQHEDAILAGDIDVDLISLCCTEVRESVENAKSLARLRIFSHPKKIEVEIGAFDIIATILHHLVPVLMATVDGDGTGFEHLSEFQARLVNNVLREVPIELQHDRYALLMAALDFVSGMTDNYAIKLSHQLREFSNYTKAC
ncbi:MAG: deoxyguanosinetriphosphate triphosphohydrolase [Pseudomonadales bacterium]|nr:deoxyguanosinetriphosphate triphosphohydrolase [Pseudomonadales bacterium]